jgi:hypothetical protein
MKRGAKTQHRRNLRDEKAVYNRTCEEWIVRLHELEPGLLSQHVAGTDESTLPCARTLCFVVTQSRKWLDYRPKKTTTDPLTQKKTAILGQSRLHRLGLHRYHDRTSMSRVCSLSDVCVAACRCGSFCLFNAKKTDLAYFRGEWQKATGGSDEDRFHVLQLVQIAYEDMCSHALHLLLGVSESTAREMKQ